MYNLHTCHHEVLFSWAHWIEMDGERGWNQEVTFTWLLRSFFAEVALWWAVTPNTNITVSVQKDIYILPIMFLPSPYWITQTISYCHKSEGIYISNYLSFQAKWTTRNTAPSSTHWKNFLSTLHFWVITAYGDSATDFHLQMVPAYDVEQFVN